MTAPLTDAQVAQALQKCADEPVHIPGIVQSFGCLLAVSAQTGIIHYASENSIMFLGEAAEALLGRDARLVLGREPWHDIRNAISRLKIATQTISAGEHKITDQVCAIKVHLSGEHHVIEIEPARDIGLEGPEALKTLSYLMMQIQSCESEDQLFKLTVGLMQHLTGYDRVLIYRFDTEFNGEVLSEVTQGPIDSFLGLRFPHWDIPPQAREIMAKVPLRFIEDIKGTPIPILAAPDQPPLDITLAETRGVSPVHLAYLGNMGVRATMTLSVQVNQRLWGIISFHHCRPKMPAPAMREVLTSFLMVFGGKLEALHQQTALDRIKALDQGFVSQPGAPHQSEIMLPETARLIMDVMQAQGFAAVTANEVVDLGDTPDLALIRHLSVQASLRHETLVSEALIESYPNFADQLNGVAGALVINVLPDLVVCIFRNEIKSEVAWAGNPKKTIDTIGGHVRLSPRGSFTAFLEEVSGRCTPWSDNDIHLVNHLRTLLHAAEREAMMDRLTRQQALMIAELNHRVRNILALVRSVSRQTRRHHGSLDSYASAMESRIKAMAAAHDLSGGRMGLPVSMHDLIQLEFKPYDTLTTVQTNIEGPDLYLKPEVAPIFSLVIHELTTNAVKYGALREPLGRILVTLAVDDEGYDIRWSETGGPVTSQPGELGFGMTMIEQAVPHELAGTAEVAFDPKGLSAAFRLPLRHLTPKQTIPKSASTPGVEENSVLPKTLRAECVLVLEDNFIIAKEMADQLRDLGCANVCTCATADEALQVLATQAISFSVLDVDLGHSLTSSPVAAKLAELSIPFIFVTGYGEEVDLAATSLDAPKLTKPISSRELVAVALTLVGN